mgnify:CR=1 FL=1
MYTQLLLCTNLMEEHIRETWQCHVPHPKISLVEVIFVMKVDSPSLADTAAQFWWEILTKVKWIQKIEWLIILCISKILSNQEKCEHETTGQIITVTVNQAFWNNRSNKISLVIKLCEKFLCTLIHDFPNAFWYSSSSWHNVTNSKLSSGFVAQWFVTTVWTPQSEKRAAYCCGCSLGTKCLDVTTFLSTKVL